MSSLCPPIQPPMRQPKGGLCSGGANVSNRHQQLNEGALGGRRNRQKGLLCRTGLIGFQSQRGS